MVLFGLASLHAAATAAKTAGEEKTPGKNAGAAASLWPEKMDPSFQGSRPECFKIWVIRNLRFPADRYDVGDEAKVEVAFAIDKNGTLTDLKVTHCEERHFADRLCKTIALSPKWSPGRTKGKPVKTELEMRFVFRLVAPPAGQEELGLCAEECDIHTTADRMPLFCGGGPDGFRAWVQRQADGSGCAHGAAETDPAVCRRKGRAGDSCPQTEIPGRGCFGTDGASGHCRGSCVDSSDD